MKIGIFGGSFNPPHKMHLEIALELINKKYIDKAIYVPTGTKYPKPGLATNEMRFEMLKLMTKDYNNIEVSDYELKNDLVYTYQTLDYFKNLYKDDEIYFVLGSDLLKDFHTWREANYMLKNYHILTNIRNEDKKDELENIYPEYKDNIIITDIIQRELSSTEIREAIKNNNTNFLNQNLDMEVLDYILKNKVYIENKIC